MSRDIDQGFAAIEARWSRTINWNKDAIKDSCRRGNLSLLLESLACFNQLAEHHPDIILTKYLNEDFNPLLIAANNGHLNIVTELLTNGLSHYFQRDQYTQEGKNILLYAAAGLDSLDSVRFIISQGANINFCNHEDQTPFFWAIKNNNLEMVNYFLSREELDLGKLYRGRTVLELLTTSDPYLVTNPKEFNPEK